MPEQHMPTNSFDDPAVYNTEIGTVIAATDKGVGYKDTNEDRLVVVPGQQMFAVVDGMGGMPGGSNAADILAKTLKNVDGDKEAMETLHDKAAQKMESEGITEGGAVYQATHITENELHAYQAGDARMIVYSPDGSIVFSTDPERMMMGGLTNAVRGADAGRVTTYPPYTLADGQRIAIASDGVWDNISPEEFVKLASTLSLEATVPQIGTLLKKQMQKAGTPDNISLILCEVQMGT